MTRINVVPVSELCDQHLLAEHRELTRIPNQILKGKLKVHYDDRPSEYTLGKGHVKFFTNKCAWLYDRYLWLTNECVKRGFRVDDEFPPISKLIGLGDSWDLGNNFTVTQKALNINRARILERWPKKARYYGQPWNLK